MELSLIHIYYLHRAAGELGLQIEVYQSNHEGALIYEVHRAYFCLLYTSRCV